MNTADERLTLPPPACCGKCTKRDSWLAGGVERHRCGWGHIMIEDCPHIEPFPLGVGSGVIGPGHQS